tara:strand:+ start:1405 stop:2298 length:894 start_codon:yes stop_codon:yes gene_type:complete
MAMDFSALKKNRGNFDGLMKEVEKINTPSEGNKKDERFWQPEVDKAGNGQAVIRFLPPPTGEDLPWARVWHHAFQSPTTGKWYIENSLTTLNKPDPVSELNTELWHTGREKDKDTARAQKRKLSYISNIYIVKDPANPQNEGKAFLYKFGKKIFDKIKDVMQPEFDDEDPINPFDFWKGANFKLKIRNVEGYRNYDKSDFSDVSPLSDDDEKLENIWAGEYSLVEFTDPKNFKNYDELKKKLEMVLTATGANLQKAEQVDLDQPKPAAAPVPATQAKVDTSDEDESLSYFAKLANED